MKATSMLEQAAHLHDEMRKLKPGDAGKDHQTFLQRPYAKTQSREAVEKAPVWFTAYMPSILGPEHDGEMTRPLETLCDLRLWNHFTDLGIKAVHTGPVMKAGGFYLDQKPYLSIDGWFDPIALEIDTVLGTDRDYSRLVWIAENMPNKSGDGKAEACIIGDIVPGHTGMGPDFHLALQDFEHYPGLYVLTRVDKILDKTDKRHAKLTQPQIDGLLRDFSNGGTNPDFTRLLTEQEVAALVAAKVIPGKPQRSMGVQAGAGWSITGEIQAEPDEDGKTTRRWVYLHFFHPKQPTLNFFDSGYAAWRLVTGQLNYVLWDLRSTGVRLDANAFLGIEKYDDKHGTEVPQIADARQTWSEAHPLSEIVTNMLAWQARRLGGFSFQEMNMAVPDIATSFANGPDLAYDFITRPACEHAILTGDVSLLSFMYDEMKRYNIDPGALVHALQNHDEFTYELVHLKHLEAEREAADGKEVLIYGKSSATVRMEMRREALHRSGSSDDLILRKPDAFYNKESSNGLCTTIPGLLAAKLGCKTLAEAPEKLEDIKKGHLLLAAFNALQPGVFALSGWDIVGALPVDQDDVPPVLLNAGPEPKEDIQKDFRWVNRGAYKLHSSFGSKEWDAKKQYGCFNLPEAQALYGPMDKQKPQPDSFYNQLKHILELREELHISTSHFVGPLKNLGSGLFGFRICLTHSEAKGAAIVLFNFNAPDSEAALIHLRRAITDEWPELDPNTYTIPAEPLPLEPWAWKLLQLTSI